MRRLLAVVACALVAASGSATAAHAAFSGQNGLIVAQPVSGPGVVLLDPVTRYSHRICTSAGRCGRPVAPRWSPDGREIVFVDSGRIGLVASNGACVTCRADRSLTAVTARSAAFTPDGRSLLVAGRHGQDAVWSVSLTRSSESEAFPGQASDAVTAGGVDAVVRHGSIWLGRGDLGSLVRWTRGHSPSLAPKGSLLAFARDGWVWTLDLAHGRGLHRIARGSAPAFSPDGNEIAFVGKGHFVFVVPRRGGSPHRIGAERARTIDWGRRSDRAASCAPPGNATVYRTQQAVIWWTPPVNSGDVSTIKVYGCALATGIRRTLLSNTGFEVPAATISHVAVAGVYAAVNFTISDKYAGSTEFVAVYDVRAGRESTGSETCRSGPYEYPLDCFAVDSLQVNSRGFAAWHEAVDNGHAFPIGSVSCPSTSLCVAAAGPSGIWTSTHPQPDHLAWNVIELPGAAVYRASCSAGPLCFGPSGNSTYRSSDPTAGAGAWTPIAIQLNHVACPSTSLCVGIEGSDGLATTTDPLGDASTWSVAKVKPGTFLVDLACPSPSLCVAVDSGGNVLTSTNPAGGAGAWTSAHIASSASAVSCPTATFCAAVVDGSGIATSTAPGGGAGAWHIQTVPTLFVYGPISCPSPTLCVVAASGGLLTSSNPTGGADAWSTTTLARTITALSCPTTTLCVAGDEGGQLYVTDNPTGGAGAWPHALVAATPCTFTTGCIEEHVVAADDTGVNRLDTTVGAGHSLTNVALGPDSVTWLHDGVPRLAPLR